LAKNLSQTFEGIFSKINYSWPKNRLQKNFLDITLNMIYILLANKFSISFLSRETFDMAFLPVDRRQNHLFPHQSINDFVSDNHLAL
jgi:hypothetical protein